LRQEQSGLLSALKKYGLSKKINPQSHLFLIGMYQKRAHGPKFLELPAYSTQIAYYLKGEEGKRVQ
jgi:hypothetical protein